MSDSKPELCSLYAFMELLPVALNTDTVNRSLFSFTCRARKLQIAPGHFFISMSISE